MLAASSRVMTVAVTFTRRSLSQPLLFPFPFSLFPFPSSLFPIPCLRQFLPSPERNELHGFEVHERAVVGDDRVQLGEAGSVQVALRLEQLERRRQPDVDPLLFRV